MHLDIAKVKQTSPSLCRWDTRGPGRRPLAVAYGGAGEELSLCRWAAATGLEALTPERDREGCLDRGPCGAMLRGWGLLGVLVFELSIRGDRGVLEGVLDSVPPACTRTKAGESMS